jgi:predicted 3-demethylubiquinone-9 3-methyltransferase (glyoxalase superfamily)
MSRYGEEGFEIHGQEKGRVLTIGFRINGQPFTALNGGPVFEFSAAISFQVFCETQDEIDEYWSKLTAGGQENNCGWLTDKYGISWQIIPTILPSLMADPARSGRVMTAFLKMKKFDIETLLKA